MLSSLEIITNSLGLIISIIILSSILWCSLIRVIRHSPLTPSFLKNPHDNTEKITLTIMVLPTGLLFVIVGIMFLLPDFQPLSYTLSPLPLDTYHGLNLPSSNTTQSTQKSILSISIIFAIFTAFYIYITLWKVYKLIRTNIYLHNLTSQPKSDLIDVIHPYPLQILLSRTNIPPFLTLSGKIVIPQYIYQNLSAQELTCLIAHEHSHWQRGDPLYFMGLSIVDSLFWFNPALRQQTQQCRLAAEIACDEAAITSVQTHSEKIAGKSYATALVTTAKLMREFKLDNIGSTAGQYYPSIFSTQQKGELQMRLQEIISPAKASPSKKLLLSLSLIATIIATPLILTQLSLITPAFALDTPKKLLLPLENIKITSTYGRRKSPFTKQYQFHHGIDLKADIGTPVRAPAGGKVIRLMSQSEGYGNFVEIDHGNGLVSRYGQLDSFKVTINQQVRAGQVIALTGNSGHSTGPHLHMEIWQDGASIDPQSVMDFSK